MTEQGSKLEQDIIKELSDIFSKKNLAFQAKSMTDKAAELSIANFYKTSKPLKSLRETTKSVQPIQGRIKSVHEYYVTQRLK
jgi:hypothetical protein